MKAKYKFALMVVVIVVIGATFSPLFDDPFHEKTGKVCFWEWLAKEIWEFIHGERTVA